MEKTPNNPPRGRPASGRSPIVSLALTASLIARVDASADEQFETRTRAIRRLLESGLCVEDRERRS